MLNRLKNSELIKNAAFLIGSNGLAQIATLLIYPFIARLYTPDEFGQLAVIISIHSLIVTVASGRYEQAIILPKNAVQASDLFTIGWRIAVIISLLIAPVVFLIQRIGFNLDADYKINFWFYLLGIMVFTAAYQQLVNGWCIRYKMFKIIVGSMLVMSLSNAILKLILGFLKIPDGLLYSFFVAQIITALFLFVIIRRNSNRPLVTHCTADILVTAKAYSNFPKYNMITALLNTFSSNLPIYALALYFSGNLTGQFSIAFALLFRPVSTYNSSVYQVLMQKLVEMKHSGSAIWPMIKKYISKTLFLTIGPGIILMLLIPQIIRIYLGDNWTEAGRFCQLIIPYAVGALISGSLAFVPNIFNKQLKSLIIDVVYLLMRTGALAVGIVLRNVYIAVGLYALAGVMVVSYQIFWYRKLLIESDRIIGIQG